MTSSTLPFQRVSPVQGLTGLARQIALPHDNPPQRFPSFPALERTAVMGFNAPVTWNIPESTASRAFLSRSATYPLWTERTAGTAWYGATYYTLGTNASYVSEPMSEALYGTLSIPNSVASTYLPRTTGLVKPADFLYPVLGVDGPAAPFIYVPSGWKVLACYSLGAAPSADTQASVDIEEWVAPGEYATTASFPMGLITAASGYFSAGVDATTNIGTGKWVRPKFLTIDKFQPAALPARTSVTIFVANATSVSLTPAANAGAITIGSTGTSKSLLPAVTPNEFATSVLPWSSTRTTAAAALFTNVTQVLNKGGTVLCGRLSPTATNPFLFTSTTLQTLHPAEKAYLPLETGAYSYCPPSTDLASFTDHTASFTPDAPISAGSYSSVPVYRLDNTSLVNAFVFTPTGAAESMAINVDWHIEFRTNSALFQIGLSSLTLEAFHQAQLALVQVGFFFPNSWHKQLLNKVISAVKQFGPSMLRAAAQVHPVTRAIAATVPASSNRPPPRPPTRGRGGRRRPPPSSIKITGRPAAMPTTTPARSGIIPPKRKGGLQMYLDSRKK